MERVGFKSLPILHPATWRRLKHFGFTFQDLCGTLVMDIVVMMTLLMMLKGELLLSFLQSVI